MCKLTKSIPMNKFLSLLDLLKNVDSLSDGEWVYANLDIWQKDPKNCPLYYITDDYIGDLEDDQVYLDDNDLEMPISVQNLNLYSFLTVGDISHIYHKNNQNIDKTIQEISHYREFDDFLS